MQEWSRRCGSGRRRLLRIAATLILNGAGAHAHDLWIEPERFHLPAGEPARVRLMIGHTAERAPWAAAPRRVLAFRSVSAAMMTDRQTALHSAGPDGPAVVAVAEPGLHVLYLESGPAEIELPGPLFDAYVADNGLTAVDRRRRETGAGDRPGREVYSRRAKALIVSGAPRPADVALATRPLGLTLELTPLADPFRRTAGAPLALSVRYRGEPLAGALVRVSSLDLPLVDLMVRRSDAAGEVSFGLPPAGAWLFSVVWSEPIADHPRAEFETVFSTLTLGHAPRP